MLQFKIASKSDQHFSSYRLLLASTKSDLSVKGQGQMSPKASNFWEHHKTYSYHAVTPITSDLLLIADIADMFNVHY